MNALALALSALRGIATLLSNPILGGQGRVRASEAAEMLSLLGSLIEEGEDAFQDLKVLTESIEAMNAANRAPTPTEWGVMRARAQSAHDRLQAVKEALSEPEEEATPEAEPTPEAASEAEEATDPPSPPEGQP